MSNKLSTLIITLRGQDLTRKRETREKVPIRLSLNVGLLARNRTLQNCVAVVTAERDERLYRC